MKEEKGKTYKIVRSSGVAFVYDGGSVIASPFVATYTQYVRDVVTEHNALKRAQACARVLVGNDGLRWVMWCWQDGDSCAMFIAPVPKQLVTVEELADDTYLVRGISRTERGELIVAPPMTARAGNWSIARDEINPAGGIIGVYPDVVGNIWVVWQSGKTTQTNIAKLSTSDYAYKGGV